MFLLACLELSKVADYCSLLIQRICFASKLKFESFNTPLMETSQVGSINCSNFPEKAKKFLSCSSDIWQLKILNSWKHFLVSLYGALLGGLGSEDHRLYVVSSQSVSRLIHTFFNVSFEGILRLRSKDEKREMGRNLC